MKTLKALLERVVDADPEVRRRATAALSKLKTASAREALVGCLDHRDAQVRRLAAAALASRQADGLLPVLLKSARLETDARTQTNLWRAVARSFKDAQRIEDLPRLTALMSEPAFPDECLLDFCGAALHILSARPEKLPEALIGLLADPAVEGSPLVQTAMQKSISSLGGQRFARSLGPAYVSLLQERGYEAYHPAFIEALGNMREKSAIGTVLEKFENVPELQDKALAALSLIGVEHLDPVMALAARLHEEIYFRTPREQEFITFFFESAQALAARGAQAVPVLMRLLDHSNGAMRQNARFALESIKDPEALRLMLRVAENRRDEAKTRLAWELVRRNHPDLSVKALAAEQLEEDK